MKPPNNLQSADQAQSEIGQYLEGKNAKAFNFARGYFFSEGISATPFQGQQIYRTDDRRGDFIVLTGQLSQWQKYRELTKYKPIP
ncbi:hypothetical protein EZJ55_24850 [Microcystis aeruginosa EAWAG127a]|uniref:Uncharacterized protein n=1 Tax=Microcystis aeruginosa EAWAG127a TaxID=2529855 RepID=A0A5J5LPM7_MICAE|nr:hypothetical protein [Microcystis aeruginosa]KAB0238295.1 hypothetical protein EZJ55_24850 [Microcystis aeruginosa EAWAG127a]